MASNDSDQQRDSTRQLHRSKPTPEDLVGLQHKVVNSWFGIPVQHFKCCPWKEFKRPGALALGKWKFITKNNSGLPDNENRSPRLDEVLPVIDVSDEKLKHPPKDKIQVTWIGHATVLVQFDGATILTDPVFEDRCGPSVANKLHISYKRYRPTPCKVEDLPKIDAVVISHNHYDHLEESAVKKLANKDPNTKWFVTLEQKKWIKDCGVLEKNISELAWWGEEIVHINGGKFEFICTPSQHWCQRSVTDMNKVLWCSWVIRGPNKSFFFAGDTGYYKELFKTIGKYGPFDLAAIPIGAYEPRIITEFQHVNPAEAVMIHNDVDSKQSIGIHWGTFELTNEFFAEPPQKVEEEMQKQKLDPNTFIALYHGETWVVGENRERPRFMDHKSPKGTPSQANLVVEKGEEVVPVKEEDTGIGASSKI